MDKNISITSLRLALDLLQRQTSEMVQNKMSGKSILSNEQYEEVINALDEAINEFEDAIEIQKAGNSAYKEMLRDGKAD